MGGFDCLFCNFNLCIYGNCFIDVNFFRMVCNCELKWVGEKCDLVDNCNFNLCINGYWCINEEDGFCCYNLCLLFFCGNNGMCRVFNGFYVCNCLSGYLGLNCE